MQYLSFSVFVCCAAAIGAAAQQARRTPPRPSRPTTPRTYPAPNPASGGIAAGSVLSVDSARGTLVISGRSSRDKPQQVQVRPEAAILKQSKASAADLKVGDVIEVVGAPLEIDARTIRMGEVRPPSASHPDPKKPGASRKPSSLPAVQPQLLGKVVKLNPLAVELGAGVTASVKVTASTSFVKIATIPLNSLKAGDPVLVMGSRDPNGTLLARRIQVGFEGFPGVRRSAAPKPSARK
jgi:hypothetical protein